MTRSRAFLLVSGLYGLGLVTGASLANSAVRRLKQPFEAAEPLLTVLRVIERDYIEPRTSTELTEAAIEGVVASLDEHSHWLEEVQKVQFELETHGQTYRSPLTLQESQHGPLIQQAPEEPLIGAHLLEIDGTNVANRSLDEVEALLSRPRRRPPRLRVRDRAGREREVDLPEASEARTVAHWEVEGGIGTLRLDSFQAGTANQVRSLVSARPAERVLLDLRGNPGGLLDEAVAVADLFLSTGVVVTTRIRNEPDRSYLANPGDPLESQPLAVLTDRQTASAAEIVAAALQDGRRGIVLGEPTYGKGSIQQLYRHPDGEMAALKLTVGTYQTADGQPVTSHAGRSPDLWISSADAARLGRQLLGSLAEPHPPNPQP